MPTTPAERARATLRSALTDAMRARDRVAAAALRAGMSAIDQAEAVPIDGHPPSVGTAGDVPRRMLTDDEVRQALLAEVAERRAALDELRTVGQDAAGERVARELEILTAHLPPPTPTADA